MIRKIQSIKSFGVFSNFQWASNLPIFNKYNLIYGWNYSGKTTLSRVFRCFEKKQLHPDFLDGEIKLETDDSSTYEPSNVRDKIAIQVFNSDFINENLSFIDGTTNPILILGKEEIEKQKTLDGKTKEFASRQATLDDKRQKINATEMSIESAKTTKSPPHAKKATFPLNLRLPDHSHRSRHESRLTQSHAQKPRAYLHPACQAA